MQVDVAAQQTYVAAFAFKFATLPASTAQLLIFQDTATVHVDLRLTTAGQLQITRNGTVLGTSVVTLSTAAWYHIQVKVTIDDSTGTYEVRLDGTNVLSGTGADTRNGGAATANRIKFQGVAGSSFEFDDVVILDTTGAANNDFPGEVKITLSMPTGAGNYSQWTPSTGSNWQNVDENPINSDTDFNSSSTAGQIDTFARAAVTVTGAILGVKANLTHRKDDAGTREIAALCRSGGADTAGATKTCNSSYRIDSEYYEQDPSTAAAWTESGFNAAEFGVKVIT
jgi:hypothetical protein